MYQLSEMRGMVRLGGPYELLGLTDESIITNALHASEGFLAKSSEIQQVIDHSMRDYKAFFRYVLKVKDAVNDAFVITLFLFKVVVRGNSEINWRKDTVRSQSR